GSSFQGIEKIYVGKGQALAKIRLPEGAKNEQNNYTLHPSLLDVIFQSAIGLILSETKHGMALPFALDELLLMGECLSAEWAFVRQRESNKGVTKLDIDVYDEWGNCVLQIKGLNFRII